MQGSKDRFKDRLGFAGHKTGNWITSPGHKAGAAAAS
jgi:hypothetical protein